MKHTKSPNPFSLFDRVYLINLDEREDRWEQAKLEFSKFHIDNYIRFPAIKNEVGHVGCAESHLSLLQKMQEEKVEKFLIMEDDFTFKGNPLETLSNAIQQLPADWDMLYLGASTYSPLKRYSKNLFHLHEAYSTHAIGYNNKNGGLLDYILNHRREVDIIDVYFRENIQDKFNCFISYPLICAQKNSFSDVQNNHVNMEFIEHRYWKCTRGSLSLSEKLSHWLGRLGL